MSGDTRPTKKQRELLNFLDGFIKGNGYGPSYREVMRALDYKSVSTVAAHVDGLIARGYLRKRDKSARSLEVVLFPQATAKTEAKTEQSHEVWLGEQIVALLDTDLSEEDKTALERASQLLLPDQPA